MIALLLGIAQAWVPIADCGGQPTRWQPAFTTWQLHVPSGGSAHSTLSDQVIIDTNTAGWEVWSQTIACCSGFQASYGGTTTSPYSDTMDGVNVLDFEEYNWDPVYGSVNATIAITLPRWYENDCVIVEADQLYNSVGFTFATGPNPSQTDLQSIMAHENGHWLGLGHSSEAQATMYAYYAGGTGQRTLHLDDEQGVCALHPGTCGDQEICGNGLDDDGDGAADCADPDCAAFAGCGCPITGFVGCDNTIQATNADGEPTVDTYTCSDFPLTGPEGVYTFTPNEDGVVRVALTDLTADVDLIVTTESGGGSCEPNNCLASNNEGLADEEIVFNAFGGVTYTVVADGYDGAVATFTLTTSCPVPEGGGDCIAELPPLACDAAVEGSNFGFTNEVQAWNCVQWETTGPEAIYELTVPTSGMVAISLTGLSADLDLFVSDKVGEGCSEEACLAFSGAAETGDEYLTFRAEAGVTYMVVVDGYSGNTSDFVLDVRCGVEGGEEDPSDPPPDDPGDTGVVEDPFEDCGCRSGPAGVWGALFLVALGVMRRRRRVSGRRSG